LRRLDAKSLPLEQIPIRRQHNGVVLDKKDCSIDFHGSKGTTPATGTLTELKKNSTVHAKKLTKLHLALP
jgi:hypothetical protein